MIIELIKKAEYNKLLRIQKKHPILTYQQNGYDEFDKSKMTEKDEEVYQIITDILRKSIKGFSRFQNFCISPETGDLKIRFQYNWTADEPDSLPFIGVGYLYVDELLNGFRKKELIA
jgi:hypothetical protein